MHVNISLFNASRRAGYAAALHDRADASGNGLEIEAFALRCGMLAACNRASRIVNPDSDHGFAYSI